MDSIQYVLHSENCSFISSWELGGHLQHTKDIQKAYSFSDRETAARFLIGHTHEAGLRGTSWDSGLRVRAVSYTYTLIEES